VIGTPFLSELGWVVAAAAVALLLTRPLRLPPVLVYVLAGLVLGPATGIIHPSESLDLIGEVGIALLLFLVGLELSPAALRDVGRNALLVGTGQVLVTAAMGVAAGQLLGWTPMASALLGLAVAFSSTVVVVKLLDRTGQLGSAHGRLAVGILLVQDVVVAVVLTLMAGLGSAGELEAEAVAEGVALAFGGLAVLVIVSVVSARTLLPPLVRWMIHSPDGMLVASLAWCFLFILGAEALHLSVELGAFLAGLTLAPTVVHGELRRRVQPLADLFLAVFFVVLGAELRPGAALDYLPTVLALVGLVLFAKPAVLIALARFGARLPRRTSVLTATTLGQMSEFSFILTAAAVSTELVAPELTSIVGMAGLITIGISASLVQTQERLWERFGRPAGDDTTDPNGPPAPPLEDHVVIVGMNSLGRRLVEALHERGDRVLAVDSDPNKLARLDVATLQGNMDHWSVLEAAGVPKAQLVVSALQIEDANTLLAYRCRALGVPVSIHAFDASVRPDLEALGVDHLMDSKREGARRLRDALAELEVLE
jgi:Kef-type K+ transport system membrane component KefB